MLNINLIGSSNQNLSAQHGFGSPASQTNEKNRPIGLSKKIHKIPRGSDKEKINRIKTLKAKIFSARKQTLESATFDYPSEPQVFGSGGVVDYEFNNMKL